MNSISDFFISSTRQAIYHQEDIDIPISLDSALKIVKNINSIIANNRRTFDSCDAYNSKKYVRKILARPEVRKNQELKEYLRECKKYYDYQIRWQSNFYSGVLNYNNFNH